MYTSRYSDIRIGQSVRSGVKDWCMLFFWEINYVFFYLRNTTPVYVTCSAKTGFMAYFKNNSFKDLVCRNSPMVEATSTKFSLVSNLLEHPLYKNQATM